MSNNLGFLPYEPVEHTADLAYIARGRSLEELFAHAAEGMMAFLIDPGFVGSPEEDLLEIDGRDVEELLISFLQEILFRLEVRGRIYRAFEVERAAPPRLRARARGEDFDPARHELQADIKAATYHDLRVVTEESAVGRLWRVRIVLDI